MSYPTPMDVAETEDREAMTDTFADELAKCSVLYTENLVVEREALIAELATAKARLAELEPEDGCTVMGEHAVCSTSPSERLANICAALEEDLSESPFTREEWERLDAERLELLAAYDALAARLVEVETENATLHTMLLGQEERRDFDLAQQARLADERNARAQSVVRLGKARELLQELYSNSSDRYMAKEIANWLGFADSASCDHAWFTPGIGPTQCSRCGATSTVGEGP
ncbi:hypothetical protein CCP3SC15_580025 [Gammaproteobacteria bacterium]